MFDCEEGPFCSSGLPPTGDPCPELGDVCCQMVRCTTSAQATHTKYNDLEAKLGQARVLGRCNLQASCSLFPPRFFDEMQ